MSTSETTEPKKPWKPAWVFHPNELILEELQERGWSVRELATRSQLGEVMIRDVLDGKRVTKMIAYGLSQAFLMSPQFWINMQKMWDDGTPEQRAAGGNVFTGAFSADRAAQRQEGRDQLFRELRFFAGLCLEVAESEDDPANSMGQQLSKVLNAMDAPLDEHNLDTASIDRVNKVAMEIIRGSRLAKVAEQMAAMPIPVTVIDNDVARVIRE